MRWLVTGAAGMLGSDATALLAARGHQVDARARADLDLTDSAAVAAAVADVDVVLNCAAWTAVDDAEDHEAEALVVNGAVPRLLAEACAGAGAMLVHLSTDYVFAGDAREPYPEGAPLAPRSAYGRTKAAGEESVREALPERHLIVRTGWLYGANGQCFPKTILRAARVRGALDVVDDQVGQPTWTLDVADLIERLVRVRAPSGTYHATSQGQASWFEFARAVVQAGGLDPHIVSPTDSSAYQRPAERPAYSVLGHDLLGAVGVEPIGPWRHRWTAAASEVLAGVE